MEKKTKWDLVKTEEVVNLSILNAAYHYYRNPRNDKVIKTVSLQAHDAANVIALTEENKVILVKQFRFGIGDYTLEIPGGMVDEGENAMEAAKRELQEETGYEGENWEFLGRIYSNPVFINSSVFHYLARGVSKQGNLKLDDAEAVELVTLSIEEAYDYIDRGIIQHPHTITAFHFAAKILNGIEDR